MQRQVLYFLGDAGRLRAQQRGGPQERDRRGGTENTPGIVGLGVAAELAQEFLADAARIERLTALRDRFERAIVDAVIRLAHALGKKVVAEGVENVRQQKILAQLGCDELQGYLFAQPMTARALLLWALDDRRGKTEGFRSSLFVTREMQTKLTQPPPALPEDGPPEPRRALH